MTPDKLQSLRIPAESKVRSQKSVWLIFLLIALATGVTLFFAWPREADKVRLSGKKRSETAATKTETARKPATVAEPASSSPNPAQASPGKTEGSLLTVSGYIITRERIELSPRFMGTVTWIGVKKGDSVTNGQVVVLLDDSEYRARQHETAGRLAAAQATLEKAKLQYERVKTLATISIESKQNEDDMRLNVAAAASSVKEIEGSLQWINTYVDWCTIRSPINGVVLEKLVDPNELVTPQSFGGTRGPSTALIAVADLKDLQVEIDLNEADVAKVYLSQKCKVSPEAYPDRVYDGYVAEKAPEASRQKGTLQIKVQIKNPDDFLTPELSAKVDFLPGEKK
ncbi:MAG: Secretion protein HlyD family protein [Verrucomicrobiales bacterium]|nr:Secretion protein HlyD family protein [Verrucomicrobiales bacterium]